MATRNPGSVQALAGDLFETARREGFRLPRRIRFGAGAIDDLAGLLRDFAPRREARLLLVSGATSACRSGLLARLHRLIGDAGLPCECHCGTSGEPTPAGADEGARAARSFGATHILSAGGGSVIDAAKAVAALAANPGPIETYMEGVGTGATLAASPLPHMAVQTVAGSGAEMTCNAVLRSPGKRFKRSLRHEGLRPGAVVLDPRLTWTVPRAVTAAGGLDAVAQLMEVCITRNRNPVATELAREGLRLAGDALPRCVADPVDGEARERMLLAAALGGIGLSNAGLAMAHGLAAGLGAVLDIPHGIACAMLLPPTLAFNREACEEELAAAFGAWLGESEPGPGVIERGLDRLREWNAAFGIPNRLPARLTDADLELAARRSMAGSMRGNPREVTEADAAAILGGLR